MDKIIATVFLVIGTVIGSLLLIDGLLPSIGHSVDSLREAQSATAERIKSDIDILLVVQDPQKSDSLIVWVKNVGSTTIGRLQYTDLFLSNPQGAELLSYSTDSTANTWSYCLESQTGCSFGTVWKPTVTMKATVTLTSLVPGNYNILLVLPIGVQSQKDFTV